MVGNIHEQDYAPFSLGEMTPVEVDHLLGMRAQIAEIAKVLPREKKGRVESLLLQTPIQDHDQPPTEVKSDLHGRLGRTPTFDQQSLDFSSLTPADKKPK